jgi:hypothetical protein
MNLGENELTGAMEYPTDVLASWHAGNLMVQAHVLSLTMLTETW